MAVNNGDTIKVVANMFWDGVDNFQHVYHVRYTGTDGETDLNVMGAAVNELQNAYAFLDNEQNVALSYGEVDFYNMTQDIPMGAENYAAAPTPVETTEALPLQCQGLVLFYTSVKRSVGKKYIPGFTHAQTDDGQTVDAVAIAAMEAYGNIFLSPIATPLGQLTWGHYRPATTFFIPWTSRVVRTGIYTQRRRRLGVGA